MPPSMYSTLRTDPASPTRPKRSPLRYTAYGDLKLLLLALIAQQPRHGYELIRQIGEMSHGQYVPSPGSVYPLLSQLESDGHTMPEASLKKRKRYRITPAGMHWIAAQRSDVDDAWRRLHQQAKRAVKQSLPPAVQAGMRALKRALLMQEHAWAPSQAEAVAAILQQASAAISAELSNPSAVDRDQAPIPTATHRDAYA